MNRELQLKFVQTGDILYDPHRDQILEIIDFGYDDFGQRSMICLNSRSKKMGCEYTLGFVFKYGMLLLDRWPYDNPTNPTSGEERGG